MKQFNGSEDIKLPGHEKFDSNVPGKRRHIVLSSPLVNLFQKLLGGLFEKETETHGKKRGNRNLPVFIHVKSQGKGVIYYTNYSKVQSNPILYLKMYAEPNEEVIHDG